MLGRKRKKGHREANGRPLRARVGQQEASAAAEREATLSVAMAQPHRLGDADPRCSSALGRFCLRNKLKSELLRAGEAYAGIVRRWRAAKGVPTEGNGSVGGSGGGPSDATVREWGKQRLRCDRAMMKAHGDGMYAVVLMTLYEGDCPDGQAQFAIWALTALAAELGVIGEDHPFR